MGRFFDRKNKNLGEGEMKKILICGILCLLIVNVSFGAVRKNWKVTKNAIIMLQNQSIEVAKHIYGNSDKTLSQPNKQTIYIWGSKGNKLKEFQTAKTSNENDSILHVISDDYGYNCFIALKTDANGIIIDGIQVGFEPDRVTPSCREIFDRSYRFCKLVVRETEKEKKLFIPNFHRYDLSKEDHIDFIIPEKYQKEYYYQEDHDINKFFNN